MTQRIVVSLWHPLECQGKASGGGTCGAPAYAGAVEQRRTVYGVMWVLLPLCPAHVGNIAENGNEHGDLLKGIERESLNTLKRLGN